MNSYKSLYKMLVNQQQQINLLGKMLKVVTKMAVDPTAHNDAMNAAVNADTHDERYFNAAESLNESLGVNNWNYFSHPDYHDTAIALDRQLTQKGEGYNQ